MPPDASILSTGTAVPPFEVPQKEALAFLLDRFPLKPSAKVLAARVFAHPSVRTRRFAVERLEDFLEVDPDRLNERFRRSAIALAAEALATAFGRAGVAPSEVDFLAAATCTGYLCPGLAAWTAEAVGFRPDVRTLDLAGMGCGAALPALQAARDFLGSHPGKTAAVVCAEVCSAAFFSGNEAGLVVSNALFGDGAAAAVMRRDGAGPRLAGFESLLRPEWRETLRFKTEGGRLRNVLGPEVPDRAAEAMEAVTERLLKARALRGANVDRWMVHPGGAKVIDAVENRLGLAPEALAPSREVLARFGNMSSPSCLFVLEESLASRPPRRGERGVLAAFGAGFSAHAALLEF
jgi:predicted naringenin-chalcone synthase